MTTLALYPFSGRLSSGASETARVIADGIAQWRSRLQDSYALGQRAKGSLTELCQVFDDCRHANWDGYGARPVAESAFRLASQFLEALPLGTPAPSVGAEPDGHLTLEWHRSPRRTLSLSMSPEGDLHYAALLGTSKRYGTEPFCGEAPPVIVDLIGRVLTA